MVQMTLSVKRPTGMAQHTPLQKHAYTKTYIQMLTFMIAERYKFKIHQPMNG